MIKLFKKQSYSIILIIILVILLLFTNYAFADEPDGKEIKDVICNVINFVRKLGLPVMTLIIIGSSVMAMFGRLQWATIMILVVFTAVFFGADKLVGVFTKGVGVEDGTWLCDNTTAK